MTLSHLINTALAAGLDGARAFVAGLNARERTILSERMAADAPRTLDDLGLEFGVTRERVRQLEAAMRTRLLAWDPSAFLADVRGGAGVWILQASALRDTSGAWLLPLDAQEPAITPLHLLRALDLVQVHGEWVSRGVRTPSPNGESIWEHLVALGEGGLRTSAEFAKLLAQLGVDAQQLPSWLADNSLVLRHGMVRSGNETMREFLINEFRACNHPVPFERVEQWVAGRWSAGTAKNLMQADTDTFARLDVSLYGLTVWNMRVYRGIREEIEALVRANGPTPIGDVVDTITSWFDVTPGSVRSYAQQAPFEVHDGMVRMARGSSASNLLPPVLADLTNANALRHVFVTDDGFALRVRLNKDHLRGSGWLSKLAVAAICGVAEGRSFEMPFSNCPGTLKVMRTRADQPAFGSIKPALEALGAALGDYAFICFHGPEGAPRSVSLEVLRQADLPAGGEQLALALCAGGTGYGRPLERVAAALGVEDGTWAAVAVVAQSRGDVDLLAAVEALA